VPSSFQQKTEERKKAVRQIEKCLFQSDDMLLSASAFHSINCAHLHKKKIIHTLLQRVLSLAAPAQRSHTDSTAQQSSERNADPTSTGSTG